MRWQVVALRTLIPAAALALALAMPSQVFAQAGAAGVVVDAEGVLKTVYYDASGQLMRQRLVEAKATLRPEVTRLSKCRKISLNRLEQAMVDRNGVPTEEMRNLAGLLRIEYVFYYPESKDIVIAGPAEGWVHDPSGRLVGIQSGRPICQLQDLVVALRAFAPDKQGTPLIGCSIDPTQEGLAAMQRFLRAQGSFATPNMTGQIVQGLRTSLGLQEVSINGVPADTHFAQVMVEADYRMKLIGIGLEQPPVRMVSFIDKASPAQVSRNALFRWFFTPEYNCVRVSEDGLAMRLEGDGVKLVGEDELVSSEGGRRAAGTSNKASQAFTSSFTKSYSELAERSPVFAELRNLIDMVVAAAFIQKQGYYGKAGWSMSFFGDESRFSVETYTAPKKVASAVAAVWKGNRLMTPIGGGVQIQPTLALQPKHLLDDDRGQVARTRQEIKVELAEGQWWWD